MASVGATALTTNHDRLPERYVRLGTAATSPLLLRGDGRGGTYYRVIVHILTVDVRRVLSARLGSDTIKGMRTQPPKQSKNHTNLFFQIQPTRVHGDGGGFHQS